MRTASHALITAALGKRARVEPRGNFFAFLTGSVLPDVPLFILTTLTMLGSPSWAIGMERMHLNYETNPLWISLHNTPHSLVVMGAVSLLGLLAVRARWGRWLLWFAAGATLHIVIDIFTHAGDGPLFQFPLSWTVKFDSPVSYWDPAHYGRVFTGLEYGLNVLLLIYLSSAYRRNRWRTDTQ